MSNSLAILAAVAASLLAHGVGHRVARLLSRANGASGLRSWLPVAGCRLQLSATPSVAARIGHVFTASAVTYLVPAAAAAVLYVGIGTWDGNERYRVDKVVDGGAASGLLKRGDLLITLDDVPLYRTFEGMPQPTLADLVQGGSGEPQTLGILRDSRELTIEITPQHVDGLYRLGIMLALQRERSTLPLGPGLRLALVHPLLQLAESLGTSADQPLEGELAGPVGIVVDIDHAEHTLHAALHRAIGAASFLWLILSLIDIGFLLAVRPRRVRAATASSDPA